MKKEDTCTINVSVRELVEFVFKEGDLFGSTAALLSMQEGIQVHKKLQMDAQKQDEKYLVEIPLKGEFQFESIVFRVTGRIDGLSIKNGVHFVEEIKSTVIPLESISETSFPVHWAQAQCYAFMYAKENNLPKMNVILTYYQKETGCIRKFTKPFSLQALEKFFYTILANYAKWVFLDSQWKSVRNASIKNITFPFSTYRKGQLDFIESVQNATENGDVLFAQAPTGIGKTMGVLYGTIQNVAKENIDKIFYLTARTPARVVAEKAYTLLEKSGLKIRSITITAKEKVCLMGCSRCIRDECPYAKGYYDRVNDAILELLDTGTSYGTDQIVEIAQKFKVCPFEFSLDASLWCDCIICDYNYVFDPRVYLKRYFFGNSGNGKYVFLVDEAHNLIKRSQSMFSAVIHEYSIQKAFRDASGKEQEDIASSLEKIINLLTEEKNKMELEEKNYFYSEEIPEKFLVEIDDSYQELKKAIEKKRFKGISDSVIDLLFELQHFLKMQELNSSQYCYLEMCNQKKQVQCKQFCMDPSTILQNHLQKAYSAVLFSATLSPMKYFTRMLGGTRESVQFMTTSPFPKENLKVFIENEIETKYKERHLSYEKIAIYIRSFVESKKGNYLVFFPSYAYMNKVYDCYQLIKDKTACLLQKPKMNEKERTEFLKAFSFQHGRPLVGFAVMGGIFGEGIDLVGEQLSGAIVVGVGLPGISLENMVLKKYFDDNDESGFGYAFVFPGINRVLQAVGRVIRTEEDEGAVLLIDKRFDQLQYRNLLPEEWGYIPAIHNPDLLKSLLTAFWNHSSDK